MSSEAERASIRVVLPAATVVALSAWTAGRVEAQPTRVEASEATAIEAVVSEEGASLVRFGMKTRLASLLHGTSIAMSPFGHRGLFRGSLAPPMALTATIYRALVALSDVDRGVYETLDLRLARHPSETMRYLITRTFAYALSYEEGIAFSKGGLSSNEEPPVSIHDPTGLLIAWIDVGSPSAERLHKATKAAQRVSLFTATDLTLLKKGAESIHKVETIEVHEIDPALVTSLESKLERNTKLELVRNEGHLYVTVGGGQIDGPIRRTSLVPL